MTHLEFERGQTSAAATGIMSALAARVLILLVYGELWVGIPRVLHLDRFIKFVVTPISTAVLPAANLQNNTAEGFDTCGHLR